MTDLKVLNKTMLSTEIAALTGKRNADVMRDIRTIVDEMQGAELRFACESTTYIGENGQSYPCYALDYEATMIVMTGYDIPARAKVIKRWQELEQSVAIAPPQLPAKQIAETSEAMVSMAAIFGLSGNQALLSADKATFKLIGHSPLKLLGIQLEAEDKDKILTPTEIAPLINVSSAISVNKILQELGYQYKVGKIWHMTEKGKPYGVLLDVGKSNGGTPVQQLKWKRDIVDLLTA